MLNTFLTYLTMWYLLNFTNIYLSCVSLKCLRKIGLQSSVKYLKKTTIFKKITFIDFIGEIRRIRTSVSESGAVVAIQHWISTVQIHACTCNKCIYLYFIYGSLFMKLCTNFKSCIYYGYLFMKHLLSHFTDLTLIITFCAKMLFVILLLGVMWNLFVS